MPKPGSCNHYIGPDQVAGRSIFNNNTTCVTISVHVVAKQVAIDALGKHKHTIVWPIIYRRLFGLITNDLSLLDRLKKDSAPGCGNVAIEQLALCRARDTFN